MFRNLLKPDSPLMITLTQVTDCIFLSLFWLLCCFPVVTAGGAFAALYDASFRCFRKGEKHSWQRFFHVFKENWKSGILPGLLIPALSAAGGFGMIRVWNAAVYGNISWALFAAAALLAVFLLGMLSVLLPLLSRFETGFSRLLKNTVLLSLANAPLTLALGMLNALTAFVCLRWIFPLFFLPSLAAFAGSFLLEPMFKPYMPQEEETEEEA